LLNRAHDVATTCDLRLELTQTTLTRSELQLRGIPRGQGSLDAAEELAQEGWRLAMQGGYRREEALAFRLAARGFLLRGEFAEAESRLRSALATQTEMGAQLEVARTQLVLAEVLAVGVGQGYIPKEAIGLVAQARERFLAVGAQWDLSEAKRFVTAWEAKTRAHSTG
jgi:hypothetical protein